MMCRTSATGPTATRDGLDGPCPDFGFDNNRAIWPYELGTLVRVSVLCNARYMRLIFCLLCCASGCAYP